MRTFRNSLEKHNAPYRGVSKKSDYVNYYLATTHDILEIYNESGGGSHKKGHKQINQDNFSAIINGNKNVTTKNYTSGVIKKINKEIKDASNLNNWKIPNLTYGTIKKEGKSSWTLIPPQKQKGFFELTYPLSVKPGDKVMVRFKPNKWTGNTSFTIGAENIGSSKEDKKDLMVNEEFDFHTLSNTYFEHIVRFDEERDILLSIKSKNNIDGTLGEEPLHILNFGVYEIEETSVGIKSLEKEIKPMVNEGTLVLKNLEKRRV